MSTHISTTAVNTGHGDVLPAGMGEQLADTLDAQLDPWFADWMRRRDSDNSGFRYGHQTREDVVKGHLLNGVHYENRNTAELDANQLPPVRPGPQLQGSPDTSQPRIRSWLHWPADDPGEPWAPDRFPDDSRQITEYDEGEYHIVRDEVNNWRHVPDDSLLAQRQKLETSYFTHALFNGTAGVERKVLDEHVRHLRAVGQLANRAYMQDPAMHSYLRKQAVRSAVGKVLHAVGIHKLDVPDYF